MSEGHSCYIAPGILILDYPSLKPQSKKSPVIVKVIMANGVEALLQARRISFQPGEVEKSCDAVFKSLTGLPERLFNRGSSRHGRVGHAPMGGHRMAGPNRALFGSPIADRDDDIQGWRSGMLKFLPAFGAGKLRGKTQIGKQPDRLWMHLSLGIGSG